MERFPASPRQETTPEDTADNDALREAYLQGEPQQEDAAEDADTAALREAYAEGGTRDNEAPSTESVQSETLSLEDHFNLPSVTDEERARNAKAPENLSEAPANEKDADADNAALREAYLQEETQKMATESADNAALREAYTQEATREHEAAAEENTTYGSGRRVDAYARKPESTASTRPETTAPSPEDPRLSSANLNRAYFGDTLATPETSGESTTKDVLKNLLAQNQELANAVRDLTLRLNRLTAPGAPERTPVSTIDYSDNSGGDTAPEPSLPEYQRAHEAEMSSFAKAEKEMTDRKANAEVRKAERKRIRRLERQAKKAERKESRSEWRILASKKAWAIGKAALGKLSGKGPGWTTGKNAAAATKLS